MHFYDYRRMHKKSTSPSLFGKRLREARNRIGIVQDKLGVLIGMDESCSSARISRYETGTHEPPIATAQKLAMALKVPVAFFYCDDERLAEILIHYAALDDNQIDQLLVHVQRMSEKN